MKRVKRLLIVCAVVFVLIGATKFWFSDKYVVPVLMYHKVENAGVARTDTVSPENFRKQMVYIQDHGYKVLSMDEFIEGVRAGRRFPPKSVVITFDDGYQNNFTNAVPILKAYGYPAIFFVSPTFTAKKGFLTWQQLRFMKEQGFDFGSHGMTQAYLPDILEEKRRIEIEESKKALEKELGVSIDYFAYPVSGFNEVIKAEVQRAGYKGAMATNRGHDRFNKDVYEINRIRLSDKDNSDFILWAKLTGYYNLFRELKNPY